MIKRPQNLLRFGIIGLTAGILIGYGLGRLGQGDIEDETADIRAVLADQQAAWNRGDIPDFMADYAQTDALRFASGGKITKGWQSTLEGYLARYPDTETMGQLAFNIIETEQIDVDDALVFGRWTLTREDDAPSGLFTLRMKKLDGRWKIVSDHTSSAN